MPFRVLFSTVLALLIALLTMPSRALAQVSFLHRDRSHTGETAQSLWCHFARERTARRPASLPGHSSLMRSAPEVRTTRRRTSR